MPMLKGVLHRPGAHTLAQYTEAAIQHTRGAHDAGGKIIHETPKEKRREYAAEIWRRRRARGTDRHPLKHPPKRQTRIRPNLRSRKPTQSQKKERRVSQPARASPGRSAARISLPISRSRAKL